MKIFAYEVRSDEKEIFAHTAASLGVDLECCPQILTAGNLHLCEGCRGITILGHTNLDREMLEGLKDQGVAVVSTRTVGCNHIDLAAAKELGIRICNASYGPESVSEYTVMLLLLCLRKYKQVLWRNQVNDFSLENLSGTQISSLTVGVVGTGRIGRQVMKNLSGFGCKFLCYDPYPHPEAAAMGDYVTLDALLAGSDVITIHVPLTDENFHMVNRETLAKMKDGVVLINAARGALMDMEAVTEAVENRKIGALALDVFENEDGIFHENLRDHILKNRSMAYLRQFPNVVMTPHMAFYTQEAVKSMVICGLTTVYEMLTKGTTDNLVV